MPAECCVCGATEGLRGAPLMTGDPHGTPPQRPVCGACYIAWYESGERSAVGILRFRLRHG